MIAQLGGGTEMLGVRIPLLLLKIIKTNKMDVTVVDNGDFTYSIIPVMEWSWERANWMNSEESRQGIFAKEFSTEKRAEKSAEDMGHIVNVN